MANRLNYLDRYGIPRITEAQAFTYKGRCKLDDMLGERYSFHRIGRFSVITNGFDILVAQLYSSNDTAHLIPKGDKYYEVSKKDRLRQLARVEAAIRAGKATLLSDLLFDIEVERTYYAS